VSSPKSTNRRSAKIAPPGPIRMSITTRHYLELGTSERQYNALWTMQIWAKSRGPRTCKWADQLGPARCQFGVHVSWRRCQKSLMAGQIPDVDAAPISTASNNTITNKRAADWNVWFTSVANLCHADATWVRRFWAIFFGRATLLTLCRAFEPRPARMGREFFLCFY
jgi:hypothetical protein